MKKKLVALTLSLAMAATAFAGCGAQDVSESPSNASTETAVAGTETSTEGTDVAEEIPVDKFAGTELTIVVKKHNYDTGESWEDKPAMKAAEEATGININWIMIDSGQSERINAMLAGDMPDAFIGNIVKEDTIGANKELFYDLS